MYLKNICVKSHFIFHILMAAVTEVFRAPGLIPGCSGSRNLQDNLSDLHAQVAANQKVGFVVFHPV